MPYLTQGQYSGLGYSTVPVAEFDRYEAMAEQYVRAHTFDQLSDNDITAANRRGVCELMDMLYKDEHQLNKPVLSFSNGSYSETYGLPSQEKGVQNTQAKAAGIVALYFTPIQRYRGV